MRRLPLIAWLVAAAAVAAPLFSTLVPSTPPSARRSSGGALRTNLTDSVLIFGGFNGGALNDMHVYRGSTNAWSPVTTLTARERHGLAYDPSSDRFVVFGGLVSNTFVNSVVLINGATLTVTQPTTPGTAPSVRADPVLVWVPTLQKFLVFGGRDGLIQGNAVLADTWTLDVADGGVTWASVSTPTAPSARGAACGAWDPVRQQVILFGGESTNEFNDTWTFKADAGWRQLTTTGTPTTRAFVSCAWDPNINELVVFGGQSGNNAIGGLFTFNPVTNVWTAHTPVGTPPSVLSDYAAAYSSQYGGVLLFGGKNGLSSYTNNLWLIVFNRPPAVDAGPNQSVAEASLVQLSGQVTDPDGDAVTWSWSQVSGPAVTLSDAGALAPTFTAPRVFVATPLRFTLTGDDGTNRASADVSITVTDSINEPPAVDAGPDQSVNALAAVALSGSATDPNGEAVTLAWSQLLGPAVTLSSTSIASPSFTAPDVSVATELQFQLGVTDPRSGNASDTVSVFVQPLAMPMDAGSATDGGAADGGTADGGATDGGATDGGAVDGGAADGGAADGGAADAGTVDAGGPMDAGTSDAGDPDAGAGDAGGVDAGDVDGGAIVMTDGGTPDAGPSDGGSADAGDLDGGGTEPADAGPGRTYLVGCGCTEAPGAVLWLGLLLLGVRRRQAR